MSFIPELPQKLTSDIYEGRINSYPSIIIDRYGLLHIFYKKTFISGRLSDSRVTFTSPSFLAEVEAGNGEINGTPVSWGATTLTISSNSYTLIYVDHTGSVLQSTDLKMSLISNSIVLVFVTSGGSSITRIHEVEKTGSYIFYQKQVFVDGTPKWSDYEYWLNSGEQVVATYDSDNNCIYLSYSRDGNSYLRIINIDDPLSTEFLYTTTLTSGVLTLNDNPSRTFINSFATSASIVEITDEIFSLSQMTVGYKYINSNYVPVFNIPWVESSFILEIYGIPILEIFEKSGNNYILVDSFEIKKGVIHVVSPSWMTYSDIAGKTYYFGVRVPKHNLFQGPYTTPQDRYKKLYFYPYRDETNLNGLNYESRIKEEISQNHFNSSNSVLVKSYEFEQVLNSIHEDDFSEYNSGNSTSTKVYEYEQFFIYPDSDIVTEGYNSGKSLIIKTTET